MSYFSRRPLFDDVSGMVPYEFVPAGTCLHPLTGLHGGDIYYVAIVAEDALGNFNPTVRSISAKASVAQLGEGSGLAVTCSSNALHFTWKAPAEVDAFLARYHMHFNGAANPKVLAPESTSYDVTGLALIQA